VQTASINTLNADRDAHLRTPDFFAADSFPTMTFRSNNVEVSGDQVKVHGELTLRGVTKPVVLDGRYLGLLEQDPWGQERVAFLATTTIDRQDFGVSFNQALETMTMIGDEIEIEIAIEAVRQ
jgi:polyisoprenoid-binding protein YceI